MRSRWAALLVERFGLPYWQVATTATDANRFALARRARRDGPHRDPRVQRLLSRHRGRNVRAVAGRPGGPSARPARARRRTSPSTPASSSSTTSMPCERALAHGDVACVITEPVLTNSCMVLPAPGFHAALRRADARGRHAAADRRDAHDLDRARRLHARVTDSSPTSSCSASRSRAACRQASGASRRRWPIDSTKCVREPRPGIRAWAPHCPRIALALAAMHATLREVMTVAAYAYMERLAGTLAIRAAGDHRAARRAMARRKGRCACRVHLRTRAAAERHGGGSRALPRARTSRAPLVAESRVPGRALPQHDAGLPGDVARAGVRAACRVRRGRSSLAG